MNQIGSREEALQERLLQRAVIYRVLARAYRREPDEAFFRALVSEEILSIIRDYAPRLDNSMLNFEGPNRMEDLAVEFSQLFVGPGPRFVPPCESVHHVGGDGEGLFMGEKTVQLKNIVENLGLHYSDDFHEMPDHISVEFELMYRLAQAEAELLESGDITQRLNAHEAQKVLFNNHVNEWVPGFCEKVQDVTDDPFYVWMAKMTQCFLKSENDGPAPLTRPPNV